MEKKRGAQYKEFTVTVAALLCFFCFSIGRIYGFSIFPDEFAYWAYAARIKGYDWSDITSLGSYYSYGYSLLLLPVFTLCRNAVMAYRIAIGLNFLFLFSAFIFLTKTMEKLIADDKIPIALFSCLVILFPGNLFYTQMTMTDVLLVSLYVAAGSALLWYLERNSISALVLFMLILIYLYIVHMRTIGIFISGLFVLFFHILAGRGKKRHILIIVAMTIMIFVWGNLIKNKLMLSMYSGIHQELAVGNDYGGQIDKICYIFTITGFYDFIVSILGKILYLGLATYGLFYWGIYALIRQIREMYRNIRRGEAVTPGQQFAIFIFLSVVSQILIATVYLLTLGEVDDYTYGRYNELIIPFVAAYGFCILWRMRSKVIWKVTGILALIQLLIIVLTIRQIITSGTDVFYGYFMAGISYLYQGQGFTPENFYAGAYLGGELLTALVNMIVLLGRKSRKREYIAIAFAVIELALAMRIENVYLEPFKKAAFRDWRLADKINELQTDGNIIYMDCNTLAYIGILQFMQRDTDIQIMERRNSVSDYDGDIMSGDILIFAFDDIFWQEWADKYAYEDVYGHFTVLYN